MEVPFRDDLPHEGRENFLLRHTSPHSAAGRVDTAAATIPDDDAEPMTVDPHVRTG